MSHKPERNTGKVKPFPPIHFRISFPALDGIRAVAVTAVFLRHYGGGAHGGPLLNALNSLRERGWMGVDLFFVLSGFLITGVLYDTRDDSHFFKRFYARRSLRIFPVFYLAAALLLLLTPIALYEWKPGHALFLVYMGNLLANHNFQYYALTSGRSPDLAVSLGHVWSLCVEEQFYLLWPLAVYAIRDRRKLIATAAALSLLAFGLRWAVVANVDPVMAERWIVRTLPFRMDDMLIGGLLALLLRGPAADRVQSSCKWLFLASAAATLGIMHTFPAYDSPMLLTFGLSFIALASAGLIGMALRPGALAFRVLHLRPLRVLGRYSYGFYIYHLLFRAGWVVALFSLDKHLHSLALSGSLVLSANFAVTFLVAKYSFDWFESRFLHYKVHFEYDSERRTHQHAFVTR